MLNYPNSPGYVKDSATSKAAANSLSTKSLSEMKQKIIQFIHNHDGATGDEIEVALSLRHQTVTARLVELKHFGFVYDSGVRRATRSGRMACVYAKAG